MKKTTLTVCICLMLLAGCDSSKTEKWSIVSSPDGKFGYVSWSKEVVGGFETCNGARNERDYWKKWSDEYDSTPHKFEPVKPKEYPKGYWTKVDCDQTNKPPVPGETTHGTLEIYATHSQTNYFKEVPKWGSVALCEPTNQPPVVKIDEGTLLTHAYSDSYVTFWHDGDDKQAVSVLQIGASPNGLTVSRLSTNNLWQLTNIVIETRCEPVVIGYETHWQITFKEAK